MFFDKNFDYWFVYWNLVLIYVVWVDLDVIEVMLLVFEECIGKSEEWDKICDYVCVVFMWVK